MKSYLTAFIIFTLIFNVSNAGRCLENPDVIQKVKNGYINWTNGAIQASGVEVPLEKENRSTGDSQSVLEAAKISAYENLLDVAKNVRIDSNFLVIDLIKKNHTILPEMEKIVKQTKIIKQEYLSDGTVEVGVSLNLFGAFAQLVLPPDIKQIEPIKPVGKNNTLSKKSEESSSEDLKSNGKIYSGLVIDAREIHVLPSMLPVIRDENGKEVYGSAFVSREFAVQNGMCVYIKSFKTEIENQRISDKPLVVKGLRTDIAEPASIIISNADAAKIRSTSKHLSFLRECKVIIITD